MKRKGDVGYGSYKKRVGAPAPSVRVRGKNTKKARTQFSAVGRDSTSSRAINCRYSPPFGDKLKALVTYADIGSSLNPTIGPVTAGYVYSCNGLYDPNITGTGHQPMGFDQLMVIYQRYTVIGAKAIVTFINTDATNASNVGLLVTRSTTVNASPTQIMEQGLGQFKLLSPSGSNGDSVTLELAINPNKFLDKSDPLDDESLGGTSASNPGTQCYFNIWACGNTADAGAVLFNIRLEYLAVFHMPNEITQS